MKSNAPITVVTKRHLFSTWIWNCKGQASFHSELARKSWYSWSAYAISRSPTSCGDARGGADVMFPTRITQSESIRTMAANLAMALEAQKRCWAKTLPEDAGKHLAHVLCKCFYCTSLHRFAHVSAFGMFVHVWPDMFMSCLHALVDALISPQPTGGLTLSKFRAILWF